MHAQEIAIFSNNGVILRAGGGGLKKAKKRYAHYMEGP